MENTTKVVPHYNSISTVSRLAAINIRVRRELVLTRISKSESCTRGPERVILVVAPRRCRIVNCKLQLFLDNLASLLHYISLRKEPRYRVVYPPIVNSYQTIDDHINIRPHLSRDPDCYHHCSFNCQMRDSFCNNKCRFILYARARARAVEWFFILPFINCQNLFVILG